MAFKDDAQAMSCETGEPQSTIMSAYEGHENLLARRLLSIQFANACDVAGKLAAGGLLLAAALTISQDPSKALMLMLASPFPPLLTGIIPLGAKGDARVERADLARQKARLKLGLEP